MSNEGALDSEDRVRQPPFGKSLALVLGAGLLLRWFYLTDVLAKPELGQYWFLDSRQYLELGTRLLAGNLEKEVFSSSPLYIWLVGHLASADTNDVFALIFLQQLLGLATSGCIALIGRQFFGSLAGLIGATLYLLYGAGAMLEVKVMPAVPASFLSVLAVLLLVLPNASHQTSRRTILKGISGLVLGMAALCKADLLLALPFGALGAWWFDRSSRTSNGIAAGSFVLGFCSVVSLATLHNHDAGEFVPISSQGGQTFFHGNNPRAEGTISIPEGFSGDKATQETEARALAARALGRPASVREIDEFWYGRGVSYLLSDPTHGLWLWGRKLLYWISSNELSAEYTLVIERELTWRAWLFPVPFGLMLALTAFWLPKWEASRNVRVIAVLAPVVLNVVTTLMFYCASRYRLPAVPFLAVLAGSAGSKIWQERQLSRLVPLLFAVLAVVAITFVPGRSALEHQAAGQWYLCGNEAFRHRDFERAVAYYERALEVRRRTPDIYFNLGHAYAQRGEYKRAAEAMNQVIEINPHDRMARKFASDYSRRIHPGR